MVIRHHVEGYEAFNKYLENLQTNSTEQLHIYFSGSKLPNGQSWCDDCERAAPFIEQELKKADPKSHFLHVEVGNREEWKKPHCPFRVDPLLRIMVLPTIIRWKCVQRLEGSQCEKPELLELLFSSED